jgi:hypothetical protein
MEERGKSTGGGRIPWLNRGGSPGRVFPGRFLPTQKRAAAMPVIFQAKNGQEIFLF